MHYTEKIVLLLRRTLSDISHVKYHFFSIEFQEIDAKYFSSTTFLLLDIAADEILSHNAFSDTKQDSFLQIWKIQNVINS